MEPSPVGILLPQFLLPGAGSWSLALKIDGTVSPWGAPGDQTSFLPGLTNVLAISSNGSRNLAIAGNIAPFVSSPVLNRTAGAGQSITCRVKAIGSLPLTYQ